MSLSVSRIKVSCYLQFLHYYHLPSICSIEEMLSYNKIHNYLKFVFYKKGQDYQVIALGYAALLAKNLFFFMRAPDKSLPHT